MSFMEIIASMSYFIFWFFSTSKLLNSSYSYLDPRFVPYVYPRCIIVYNNIYVYTIPTQQVSGIFIITSQVQDARFVFTRTGSAPGFLDTAVLLPRTPPFHRVRVREQRRLRVARDACLARATDAAPATTIAAAAASGPFSAAAAHTTVQYKRNYATHVRA